PDVRISGFRFVDTGGDPGDVTRAFIVVTGTSPGAVLRGLELKATLPVMAILIKGVAARAAEEAVRVERCAIRSTADRPNEGILVFGDEAAPTQGILIRDNRVRGTLRGVSLLGSVDRACVV